MADLATVVIVKAEEQSICPGEGIVKGKCWQSRATAAHDAAARLFDIDDINRLGREINTRAQGSRYADIGDRRKQRHR